jgi:RNA polymerase sigma-70 factor, ECF subfamily
LVARCQGGDLEAFNVLIARYETRVLNLSLRFLRDYHQAVDETQEIFLKVFRKINLFKGDAAFATWLYRITANHCLNVIKARQGAAHGSDKTFSLDAAEDGHHQGVLQDHSSEGPDEAYTRQELRRTIGKLLEKLPRHQRQAVILCHFENLSYGEIARVMGVTESTVRSCLYRARQHLRKMFLRREGRRP